MTFPKTIIVCYVRKTARIIIKIWLAIFVFAKKSRKKKLLHTEEKKIRNVIGKKK